MLRRGIVISLHTMRAEGKSIREIARETRHSRNTIRRYLLGDIVIFELLREKGYTGGRTILKDYVKDFHPPKQVPAVLRYETKPGEYA